MTGAGPGVGPGAPFVVERRDFGRGVVDRFLAGEKLALAELDKPERDRREVVALGWRDELSLVWMQLENGAEEPWQNFAVDGRTVKRALHFMRRLGKPFALWHSHYRSAEPSTVDRMEFPEALVDVGLVYAAHLDRTVAYNASGVISSLSPTVHSSLATQEMHHGS